MDIYREQLMDHYHRPRGWGLRERSSVQQRLVNEVCGDEMIVQLDVEGNHITAMRFEGHGCVISRAAASLLTEELVGKTVTDCLAYTLTEVQTLLGTAVQPMRVQCALLGLTAAQQALHKVC